MSYGSKPDFLKAGIKNSNIRPSKSSAMKIGLIRCERLKGDVPLAVEVLRADIAWP
jgi:hypothetical protein